jgi:hypothetical protein
MNDRKALVCAMAWQSRAAPLNGVDRARSPSGGAWSAILGSTVPTSLMCEK